jgi:hypothetical protein
MNKTAQSIQSRYLSIWKQVLGAFFDWDEEAVEQWAIAFRAEMQSTKSFFYHEDPYFYVIPLCIPNHLRSELSGKELNRLNEAIGDALRHSDREEWMESEEDWQGVKEKVQAVLAEYHERLPQPPAP